MKTTKKLILLIFTFLALATTAHAQSPREQLNHMVQQLQKEPRRQCPAREDHQAGGAAPAGVAG